MTSFHLKLIAVVSMLIDHVGRFFFPSEVLFFIIGRMAFPLFAYLVATGAIHTKNKTKYLTRLFVCALMSQLPFFFANRLIDPAFSDLNVLFTLCFGLIAITVWQSSKPKNLKLLGIFLLAIVGELASMDYGGLGILSVLFFYIFHKDQQKMLISQTIIFCLLNVLSFVYDLTTYGAILSGLYYMPFALLSLFLITVYSGKEGKKIQYLFYLIYPTHFIIIYVLKTML